VGQAIVFCGLPPSTLVALHLNLDHPAGKGRNRMVLTNDQIIEARESGGILIEPFVDKQLQGASYDLRVGFEGATTSSKKVINIKEAGFLVIQPGDFATVVVLEELHFSAMYTARFGLRSKLARKGLIPAIGPQIDPGYHGRLTVALANLSPKPISLSYGEDFVTAEFHRLSQESTRPYSGPYQHGLSLGPDDLEAIAETEGLAFSEVITTLRSLSQNVGSLTAQVTTLTSDVNHLTASMGQLASDVRSQTSRLSDVAGQLTGQRWIIPLMVGLVMAFAGIVIGIILRR
jgi:dCTP deaminase